MSGVRWAKRIIPVIGLGGFTTLSISNVVDAEAKDKQGFLYKNWSNNYSFQAGKVLKPSSQEEVEAIVRDHHNRGENLRIVGSALSPNGIAFGENGETALSLERLNKTVFIDTDKQIARFQSGMTVGQCVDELAAKGLMLENLASINLQTLGGFYQVGAHGTGATIPPVDEQILEMTLVTPGKGTLNLSELKDPLTFRMARVGLGALGVVTEFTVRCVPLHNLLEETRVVTRSELRRQHSTLITENKHCKYMWIPFEDKVVIVTANPTRRPVTSSHSDFEFDPLKKMHDLFQRLFPERPVPIGMNFADLRTILLEHGNLDPEHVRLINKAEASYHEHVQGSVVKRADDTMAFDCGGQQLVLEIATKLDKDMSLDVDYVLALLERIEKERIPAPIPIEHRFTCGSSASMSQVRGDTGDIHGWIGIVMYMPSSEETDRQAVYDAFRTYSEVAMKLAKEMNLDIRVHWAKLEVPSNEKQKLELRKELERLYPLAEFRKVRSTLDPKNILGSSFVHSLLD